MSRRPTSDRPWALKSNGTLNWPLIDDFAYAGIHDMSVAGQAVTRTYYPSPLRYSYFNGCSTGGREGLMEAQRYPADYNGIASGAPAINWTKFIPSEIWPELVMNRPRLPAHLHRERLHRGGRAGVRHRRRRHHQPVRVRLEPTSSSGS